ncbi:trypsin-like peptidase domain-containing protein [Rhizobium johnstonii]|uniref:trypsin-like peptidase domain-containing protein n=1 Tax=Rhizobium johnstonii TaxID=3019933 RepID=UPI003F9E8D66
MTYLNDEEWRELSKIILTITRGDYATWRPILFSGLSLKFRAILPNNPVPAAQVRLDLNTMKGIPLIADGVIPLDVYLREAISNFEGLFPSEETRLKEFLAKVRQAASGAPPVGPLQRAEVEEAIVHQDDMLPMSFMHRAVEASRSVAKIVVPRILAGNPATVHGAPVLHNGTCWLVAPELVLTNHHVIQARAAGTGAASATDLDLQVDAAEILFDFDDDTTAATAITKAKLVWSDKLLDFALLRIDSNRPWLEVARDIPETPAGHQAPALNVIQHPRGGVKRIAIRNNLMSGASESELRYFTDTEGGSSGSPVFDDTWSVVALHRSHRVATDVQFQGKDVAYLNIGTRMSAILAHLKQHLPAGTIPELGI